MERMKRHVAPGTRAMRLGARVAVSALLLWLVPGALAEDALSVPITVRDYAGLSRSAEPVRSGIPFPEGRLANGAGVAIRDQAGTVIPGQFRTLARWPNGSVRWLLADFLADVEAGGETRYTVGAPGAAGPATALRVEDTDALIIVTTGPLKFSVSRKRFDLIHEAWLDRNGDGTFDTDECLVAPHPSAGFRLTTGPRIIRLEQKAKYFKWHRIRPVLGVAKDEVWKIAWTRQGPRKGTTWNDHYEVVGEKTGPDGTAQNYDKWTTKSGALRISGPLQTYPKPGEEYVRFRVIPRGKNYRPDTSQVGRVIVEERGPVRVVIRAEGVLRTEDGEALGTQKSARLSPSVVIRLHAFAGRAEVGVSCQVRAPRDDVDIAEGSLSLAAAGERRAAHLWEYPVETDDAWLEIARASRGGRRTRSVDVTRLARAGADPVEKREIGKGAFSLTGANGTVGLYQRYAEWNQPQRMEVKGNLLRMVFWPMRRTTQRLDRGSQKTYEFLLTFSAGEAENWRERLKAVEHPLHAIAPGRWYADTMALGQIAEEMDAATLPEDVRKSYLKFERVQLGKVDGKLWPRGGGVTVLKSTYQHWGGFGNLGWSDGACNLHYDWPWSMLLHYVRTGDRRFFDAGETMAWCRRDRIQIWDFKGPPYGRLARYEKPFGTPNPTHTWNRGLFAYYFLTGDPGALEAARETTQGVYQYWFDWGYNFAGQPSKKVHRTELRCQGWSIDNLLNAYEWSGDKVWLDRAARIFRDSLLYMDEKIGRTGMCHPKRLQPLMAGYISEPLCRLHYYLDKAGDPLAKELLDFLERMYVGVVRDKMAVGGKVMGGRYVPLAFTYMWEEGKQYTVKQANNGIYTQFFPNVFAYLYLKRGKEEYLRTARQYFVDGMYHVPGAYHCPWAFPGTNTKIHGWSGRYNQIYLHMERELARRNGGRR